MTDQEDVDEDEDINVEDWNVFHDLTNEWEFMKYFSLSFILASPIYFQNIKVSINFCWFSLVLLLVLREEKAALSCTGKSFALDRGVNPRLISNTDCVFLFILRKNKSMIIQELCSLNLLTSPLMMTGLVTALLLSSQLPVDVSYQDGEGGGAGIFLLGGRNMQQPLWHSPLVPLTNICFYGFISKYGANFVAPL